MGILSSPTDGGQSPLSRMVTKLGNRIAWILYLIGVAGFFAILWPSMNDHTYFSENALLPGLVDEEFSPLNARKAFELMGRLRKSTKTKSKIIDHNSWIEVLKEYGLSATVQNYTVRDPFSPDGKHLMQGKNVYATVRAFRSAGTEGIVVVVPRNTKNIPALAISAALASFVKDKVYWAKDLIFLFPEHRIYGTQAWLLAYHGIQHEYFDREKLDSHSGALQAAIGLEWDSTEATHVDIQYHMINGQLPNLDLVNLANRMIEKVGLSTTIHDEETPYYGFDWSSYRSFLITSLRGLSWQASGKPSGPHGLFGQFGIEAITLRPSKISGRHLPHHVGDSFTIGKLLEGMLRSINNLLERFHQSFFFYILPSPERYISISKFMPVTGLMAAAVLIKACYLWISMNKDAETAEEQNNVSTNDTPTGKHSHSLLSCLPTVLLFHALGFLTLQLPELLKSLIGFGVKNEILRGLQLEPISLAIFTSAICMLGLATATPRNQSGTVLQCIAYLELGLMLGIVAILNFSQGLLFAIVYVPAALIAQPGKRWFFKIVSALILLLVHPFCLMVICRAISSLKFEDFEAGNFDAILPALASAAKSFSLDIFNVVKECYLIQNDLFHMATLWLLPNWTLLWAVLFLSKTD